MFKRLRDFLRKIFNYFRHYDEFASSETRLPNEPYPSPLYMFYLFYTAI